MAEFRTPIDIGNRALQHVGQELMDPVDGFTENTKRSQQISFAYGKLLEAELRRNIWRFATKRAVLRAIDTDTLLLVPVMWVVDTTYFVGSIVADENNNLWISRIHQNVGFEPQGSLTWEPYFGPMTISAWDSGTSYFSGDLVYTQTGTGGARIYLSVQNGNTDTPATATAWSATVTYALEQVITYLGVPYISLSGLNTNHIPAASPTFWSTTFVGGAGSIKWLQIGGPEFPMGVSADTINIIYPIGAGPSSESGTRNIYRLPSGFLRATSEDPKAGSISPLGGPSGLIYKDWLFEGDYIVTGQVDPIILRFVALFNDVNRMDPMFCEGLAARIAREVCEPLTGSTTKHKMIDETYSDVMTEARLVNAIEIGSEEPPEDDLITCRR